MKNVFTQLPDYLQRSLKQQGIATPTEIQTGAISPALAGKDVLATAQTGTGKTLAFLLPLLVQLEKNPSQNALVLSPTRELAQQTFEEIKKLEDEEHAFKPVLIIGGDNIHKQFADLRKHPRIIVATPGRVIDHLQRKSIDLKHTHFLVLDETDRMLDMGFIEDMRRIVQGLPQPRQTFLLSATLPKEIVSLSSEFLQNPIRVKVGSVVSAADRVMQEIVYVSIREKLPQLLHELSVRQGSVLIFTRTRRGAERLTKQLKLYGQKANALHGDLRQNRRRQVLEFFKTQAVRVLVATDVAARGIDVPHIAHVINYDLPQSPEDYIHRIGRTGRAGAVGSAISFISDDTDKWQEICKVARFSSPVKQVEKTIRPLPTPKFVAQEEGAVHAKPRKKERRPIPVSKATARAKELLAEGKVYLPQGEELARARQQTAIEVKTRARKKVATFQKAVQAARVLNTPETHDSFRRVKVGVSKKKLQQQTQKNVVHHKPYKSNTHRFKRKRRS